MTKEEALVAVLSAAAAGVFAVTSARALIDRPVRRIVRLNYRNEPVPAVLGLSILVGGQVVALIPDLVGAELGDVLVATLLVIWIMGLAGLSDDLRGDEKERGFRGHIGAALRGRITGGLIKIVAGAMAGLAAGFLLASGRAAIEMALLVALTGNLVNLLDRAPGRATKVSLAVALPLIVFGSGSWAAASAGVWGAALAVLPADLRERGMLGDAGANVLGGVLGLGLGISLGEVGRVVALLIVVALNLASERWSFSAVIDRNRLLRTLDLVGRRRG